MFFALAAALSARAADLPVLSQATCDAHAQSFSETAFKYGVRAWVPKRETPEHLRIATLSIAADFKASCPFIRGLEPVCLSEMDTVMGVLSKAQSSDSAPLAKQLPAQLAPCVAEGGGLLLLFDAMAHPDHMCDRVGARTGWSGPCPTFDPLQDLGAQVGGLKTAVLKYDAEYDGYVAAGSEAAARAAIKAGVPYTWTTSPQWSALGWSPDAPVYAGFWVAVTQGSDGAQHFEAHGIIDTDRDGCAYHMVATESLNAVAVAGTEKCR